MIQEHQIRILPEQAANEQNIKLFISKDKGIDARTIQAIRVLKRSIDARQRTIFVNLTVRIYINELPTDDEYVETYYPMVDEGPEVIVVGAGPGGLFAALRLIELGCRPIVVERGKDVHTRKRDIARISREHTVDPESNYSFGEGGAGAYSDGKLYTRSKKRGSVEKILNVFCQHGASTTILSDAHPHIGTDKLPRVIENMRETILRCGGEVHFETRMDRLIVEHNTIVGIETNTGHTFRGPVILATGHSARDIYEMFDRKGWEIQAKGFALGVRVEHPQSLINKIQYHGKYQPYMPTAEYSFVTQVLDRGVFSFCMCPGGILVPAATASGELVLNGMSNSQRNSKWANAGVVVQIEPEDFPEYAQHGPLALLEFQKSVERKMFEYTGSLKAPAQRMMDFCRRIPSTGLPQTSYHPGAENAPLHELLPEHVSLRLKYAFPEIGNKKMHGYYTNDALLLGVESRTSSPVRIPRDSETLEHPQVPGLYPCGEGAGYAGGIVSSALDGINCASKI